MGLPFVIHSLFLTISVALTFWWVNHPTLSYYNLQLIGAFVLVYFLASSLSRRYPSYQKLGKYLNAVIFSMVILLIVVSTGNLTSPIFFLIYFLLFGLSFMLEPVVAISLTTIYSIFSVLFSGGMGMTETLTLASAWFITPLALFFGQSYLKMLEQKNQIKILHKQKKKTSKQLEQDETDVLMWLTLDLRNQLTGIMDHTSNLMATMISLPVSQKKHLEKIRRSCKKLLRSSEMLKERVDRLTDNDK